MLVLTRKLNEVILIGDGEIKIRVVDIRGGRVKLGIEAPQDVRIERLENVEHSSDDIQQPELVLL